MATKQGIIAIVAAAAIFAAAATATVLSSSSNENRSKPSEGWQFENVTDIKKKEAASSDTSSTGSMANVLLFADGTIVSLDRDSEIGNRNSNSRVWAEQRKHVHVRLFRKD